MSRPRRQRSSNLGEELRGDTGASALSTLEPTPTFTSPPLTPTGSVSHPSCSEPLHTSNSYMHLAQFPQTPPAILQATKSEEPVPPMEDPFLPAHLAQSSHCYIDHPRRLCHQSDTLQSLSQCHIPLLSSATRPSAHTLPCTRGIQTCGMAIGHQLPFQPYILRQRAP